MFEVILHIIISINWCYNFSLEIFTLLRLILMLFFTLFLILL